MLTFLKHKFTRKDKTLARWGALHLVIALLAGIALAGWIFLWQSDKDYHRVQELKSDATTAIDQPNVIPPNTAKIGGPFTLKSQDGRDVTDQDFAGKYLLLYFGYTSCPDMCPTGLQSMSVALDKLGSDVDRIQPLFITVDPARDTPSRLKEYDSSFSPRILGLTGTPDQIAAVAKEYQVYYEKGEGDEDYEVNHSSLIYFVDPSGNLVSTFDEQADPKTIVATIEKSLGAGASGTP